MNYLKKIILILLIQTIVFNNSKSFASILKENDLKNNHIGNNAEDSLHPNFKANSFYELISPFQKYKNKYACYNSSMASVLQIDNATNKLITFTDSNHISYDSISYSLFINNTQFKSTNIVTRGNEIQLSNGLIDIIYNSSIGFIKQNFLIYESTQKKYTIELKFDNSVLQQFHHDTIIIFQKGGRNIIKYAGLTAFDSLNRKVNSTMSLIENSIILTFDLSDVKFPIIVDPYFIAANLTFGTGTNANFGYSVNSSGDVNGDGYSEIVIGCPNYINPFTLDNTGTAFVFYGSNNLSIPPLFDQLQFTVSTAVVSRFGSSVSHAGDVNGDGFSDIVIGAPNSFFSRGAFFIYHGSSTGINTVQNSWLAGSQYTHPTDFQTATDGSLGSSVSTAGDVNDDGYSDVIIGCDSYSHNEIGEGCIYLFMGGSAGINLGAGSFYQDESNNTNPSSSIIAKMGYSVGNAGDLNGDGYSDFYAGVRNFYSSSNGLIGQVRIYYGNNNAGTPNFTSTIISGSSSRKTIGQAVTTGGDINGDGFSDLVVSAFRPSGAFLTADLEVYMGSSGGINVSTPTQIITARRLNPLVPGSPEVAYFGSCIAYAGDLNNDSYSDLIVGTARQTSSANPPNDGGIFLYLGSELGYNTNNVMTISSRQSGSVNSSELNSWARSAGDMNGDGHSDIILGLPYYDTLGASNTGKVILITSAPESIQSLTTGEAISSLVIQSQNNGECTDYTRFAGDVNGDGYNDVILFTTMPSSGNNFFEILIGSKPPLNTSSRVKIIHSNKTLINVRSAGDVNGDGYDDIVSIYQDNSFNYILLIYLGSSTGISQTNYIDYSSLLICQPASISIGDFDSNGYTDLLINDENYSNGESQEGVIHVLYGSSSGYSSTNQWIYETNIINGKILAHASGDFSGDGYSDIFASNSIGQLITINGSSGGLPSFLSHVQNKSSYDWCDIPYLTSTHISSDINGDGYADCIITNPTYGISGVKGMVRVLFGSNSGIFMPPSQTQVMYSNRGGNGNFGTGIAHVGDINNDGYSDVVILSTVDYTDYNDLYLGSPTGLIFSGKRISRITSSMCGTSLDGFGDITGDGYGDFGYVSWNYNTNNNFEHLFYFGNNSSNVLNEKLQYNLRLRSGSLPYSPSSGISNLKVELFHKPIFGRTDCKIAIESAPQGNPFSGNPITNSTNYTDISPSFNNISGTGSYISHTPTIYYNPAYTKLRARIQYNPTTSLNGQMFGPWRYVSSYQCGAWLKNTNPTPSKLSNQIISHYKITVSPNPANNILNISNISAGELSYKIYNSIGNLCAQGIIKNQNGEIKIEHLKSGIYIISFNLDNVVQSYKFVVNHD